MSWPATDDATHDCGEVRSTALDIAAPDVPVTGLNGALRRAPKLDVSAVDLLGAVRFVPSPHDPQRTPPRSGSPPASARRRTPSRWRTVSSICCSPRSNPGSAVRN
jgi:hypothetical protein